MFAFFLLGDTLVKIIHLWFQTGDRTVTEGHREGVNEPAQRHQPAIARPSAAPYQHLFYSARIRNTKGHKVPIHQRERIIIMLMRCILFILSSKQGNGSQKTELNSVPLCSAMRNQAVQTGRNACCRSGWCGIKISVSLRVITHAQSESSSLSWSCVQNLNFVLSTAGETFV